MFVPWFWFADLRRRMRTMNLLPYRMSTTPLNHKKNYTITFVYVWRNEHSLFIHDVRTDANKDIIKAFLVSFNSRDKAQLSQSKWLVIFQQDPSIQEYKFNRFIWKYYQTDPIHSSIAFQTVLTDSRWG
jgi:hypothetical protein